MTDKFDVVIVGGGIIGTMTCFCLVSSERERASTRPLSVAFVCLAPSHSTSSKSAGLLGGALAETSGEREQRKVAEERRVAELAGDSIVAQPGSVHRWCGDDVHTHDDDGPPRRRVKKKAGGVHGAAAGAAANASRSASSARAWLHAESRAIYESLSSTLAPDAGLGWLSPQSVVSFHSSSTEKLSLSDPPLPSSEMLATDSAQLDVRSLLAAVASNVATHPHLTILEDMSLVELTDSGTRLVLESTIDGQRRVLLAGRSVLATGAWTAAIRTDDTIHLPTISFIKAHACHYQASGKTLPGVTFTERSDGSLPRVDPEVYVRPGGAVLVSGCVEEDGGGGRSVPPQAPQVPAIATVGAHDRLDRCFKSLVSTAVSSRRPANDLERDSGSVPMSTCYLPCSDDGLPIIGRLNSTSLFLGLGHSCWGISEGAATGRALAALVLDAPLPVDISSLSPNRFA
jgi:glycine/D-amino acid oxidase-like deaminating enzyme